MKNIIYTSKKYTTRDSRNEFISIFFEKYLQNSVVNVGGGGEKYLLKYINPSSYLEIDLAGNPDIKLNLDLDYPIPLADRSAECVVCTDVLEHLEEFHRTFEELLRISSDYIIISLPNAFTEFRSYLFRKKYNGTSGKAGFDVGFFSKYYGLPIAKPVDRHKWFFTYTEAETFFHVLQDKYNFTVIEELPIGGVSSTFIGKVVHYLLSLFNKNLTKDLFYRTYWVVLKKNT
jgi:hypothetical protein